MFRDEASFIERISYWIWPPPRSYLVCAHTLKSPTPQRPGRNPRHCQCCPSWTFDITRDGRREYTRLVSFAYGISHGGMVGGAEMTPAMNDCKPSLIIGYIPPGLKAPWLRQEYARTIFREPRSPTVVPLGHHSTDAHIRAVKQLGGFMLGNPAIMRMDKSGRPTVKQEDSSSNSLVHGQTRPIVETTRPHRRPCQQLLLTSRFSSGGRHHQRATHGGGPRCRESTWWFVQRS